MSPYAQNEHSGHQLSRRQCYSAMRKNHAEQALQGIRQLIYYGSHPIGNTMEEKIEQFIQVVAAELIHLEPYQWTGHFAQKTMLLTDHVTVGMRTNDKGEPIGLLFKHPTWGRHVAVPALSHNIKTATIEMRGIMRVLLYGLFQGNIQELELPRREKKDLNIIGR